MPALTQHNPREKESFAPEVWILELNDELTDGLSAYWASLEDLLQKSRVYLILRFFSLTHLSPALLKDLLKLEALACAAEMRLICCELSPDCLHTLQNLHLEALFTLISTQPKALQTIQQEWQNERLLFGELSS